MTAKTMTTKQGQPPSPQSPSVSVVEAGIEVMKVIHDLQTMGSGKRLTRDDGPELRRIVTMTELSHLALLLAVVEPARERLQALEVALRVAVKAAAEG